MAPRDVLSMPSELTPRLGLGAAIRRLVDGDGSYRFLLLREAPLNGELVNQGDADLIGTRESVHALFRFLLPMAVAGDIHFRVTCQRAEKYQLVLYSRDLADQATFDLWIDLPQIDRGRRMLRMSDLEPAACYEGRAIGRLSRCVEGALYFQHLVAKRKPLNTPHTRRRLEGYSSHACHDPLCRLAELAIRVLHSGRVDDQVRQESRITLERRLNLDFQNPRHQASRSRRRRTTRGAVCVLGVDGVGKTTLIDSLAAHAPLAAKHVTGKRLYRRSWIYQLLTRRLKRSTEAGREKFDERNCVPLFLRAVCSLATRLAWPLSTASKLMLIDRCLADFLYRGRKRDDGRFHPKSQMLLRLAPAVPTLHLVADHAVTSARKPEITETGHARYDRDLLEMLTRRTPCDHFVLFNGGSREESADTAARALSRILGIAMQTAKPAPAASPEPPPEFSLLRSA